MNFYRKQGNSKRKVLLIIKHRPYGFDNQHFGVEFRIQTTDFGSRCYILIISWNNECKDSGQKITQCRKASVCVCQSVPLSLLKKQIILVCWLLYILDDEKTFLQDISCTEINYLDLYCSYPPPFSAVDSTGVWGHNSQQHQALWLWFPQKLSFYKIKLLIPFVCLQFFFVNITQCSQVI